MLQIQMGIHRSDLLGDLLGQVVQSLPPHGAVHTDILKKRFIGPVVLLELGREDHADLIVVRNQIDEFDQRPEGLLEISGGLHTLRVGYKACTRIADEALCRPDLPHLEVDAEPIGQISHHLLTNGDGVIREPRAHIKVDRPFIERHGLGGAPDLRRQVASPVEQCDVGHVVLRQPVDGLVVEIQGLLPLLVLLVLPSLFLQRFNPAHKSALIPAFDPSSVQTRTLRRDERGDGTHSDEEF